MKKLLLVAVLAGVSLAAHAKEEAVGTLSGIKGTISVSGNGFVSKAANGTPVQNGSKVLVSTDGRAVVQFNDGCSVALSGGQHLTVNTKLSCGQQQAAVQQMFKPYRLAQAPVGGGGGGIGGGLAGTGLGTGLAIAGTIVIIGAVVVENDDTASPN